MTGGTLIKGKSTSSNQNKVGIESLRLVLDNIKINLIRLIRAASNDNFGSQLFSQFFIYLLIIHQLFLACSPCVFPVDEAGSGPNVCFSKSVTKVGAFFEMLMHQCRAAIE